MSIIHDALKRTQTGLEKSGGKASTPARSPEPSASPAPAAAPSQPKIEPQLPVTPTPSSPQPSLKSIALPQSPWPISAIVMVVIVLCLLETIYLVLSKRNAGQRRSTQQLVQKERAEKDRIVNLLTTASAASAEHPGNALTLNGIISSGGEPVALINNEIVKAGDYIDGKRVLSVSDKKVEIFSEGEVVVLTTKR